MARIIKTYQDRKNEILDTAQKLFYQKGYENTSVADVVEAVNIAKGTFYHYFKSKAELLDEIIDRMAKNIDAIIDKVLQEPQENAIFELNTVYHAVAEYKAQEKDVLLMMTRAVYSKTNIILRTKLTKKRIDIVAPRIAKVFKRGISEGLFSITNPLHISEMILHMAEPLSERFAEYVISDQLNNKNMNAYINLCTTYERAVERILGAAENSLSLFDLKSIRAFFE